MSILRQAEFEAPGFKPLPPGAAGAYVALGLFIILGIIGLGIARFEQRHPPVPPLIIPAVSAVPSSADIEHARRCTVHIDTPTGEGSGVIVSFQRPDKHWVSYVVTASHVVDDCNPEFTVKDYYGRKSKAVLLKYSGEHQGFDFALLRIEKLDWSKESVVFDAGSALPLGEKTFHFGMVGGSELPFSYLEGCMSYRGRDSKFDQVEMPAFPGQSGGGIFRASSGKCVGILTRRVGFNIALMVPSRNLYVWAWENGLQGLLP